MVCQAEEVDPDRRRRATFLVVALVAAVLLGAAYVIDRDDDGVTASAGSSTTATPDVEVPPSSSTSATAVPRERRALGNGNAITIAFAGDMNFEGPLRTRLDSDPTTAVGPFADVLRGADLAVGNLETAIAAGGTRADKQFAFRAPPTAIGALRAAGFDVVSVANNHGLDYGPDGLQETLAAKRAQPDGFVIGAGADDEEAFAPFTAVVRGQRVAVIAATQVLDSNLIQAWTATPTHGGLASAKRVDRLLAEVREARASHDTVVVFLHWGVEKSTCPSADQVALAEALADAGADLIIGGHAHRVMGGGRLGGAFVGYGLGNFLFKENSVEGARTGVLRVTITGRRVDAYEWVPGRISGSVPRPLTGAEAATAVQQWNALRPCTGLSL